MSDAQGHEFMKLSLKYWLRKPHTYLAIIAIGILLLLIDVCRSPERQISARAYIALVRVYQNHGRPLTRPFVACPLQPTCSRYSVEAVEKHGILTGLKLTASRLARCEPSVPMGTADPVPD